SFWLAFLLAADHLKSGWAGLAFAAVYLLAPAAQGAVLSDFHASSLMAALFLFALYAVHRKYWRSYLVLLVPCLLAKEDISLLVFMLGAWLFFVRHERRIGAVSMAVGLGWFAVCMLVILPHYNGLSGSPFLPRLAIFGPTVSQSFANLLAEPGLVVRWLLRPEIRAYLGSLLASGGGLSLFSPATLAIAAPSVAMNVFSTWNWTYSGGAHYSAAILPFVVVSSIYGLGTLARWLGRLRHVQPENAVLALSMLVVVISGSQYLRQGVWPLSKRFSVPRLTAHVRLGAALIGQIPPEASVSAQSNLYPHLSQREQAYFFPAVNNADYIVLDVSGVSYPLSVAGLYREARRLLQSDAYEVAAAQDGYLVMRRSDGPAASIALPESFYSFALGIPDDIRHPVSVRFGDELELVGWDYAYLNVVQGHSLPLTVTLWWRALGELSYDYQFPLFFTREDGAIVYVYDQDSASTLWRPPSSWKPGEVIHMETPVLGTGALKDVLIAVVQPGQDAWNSEARLSVSSDQAAPSDLLDGNTLYRAFHLP
ncbi:MAG: DUF2079 domain-containing protein, partial [Anaerolineae bacterium]